MKSAEQLVLEYWGKRVANARRALDLSQTAAAERIGIDQSTLSRIEGGRYNAMTPTLILRLCLGLKMDIEQAFAWPPAIVEMAELRMAASA